MSRKKTKAQHIRDGTYQPCRHGVGGLPVEVPVMPEDMPPGVAATWKVVSAQLETAGIISEIDGIALRRLCELCWIATEAFDSVRDNGITVTQTNKAGYSNDIPNPAVRVYFQAVKDITSLAKQFGMTPTGRLGMSFDEEAEADGEDLVSFSVN